MKMEWDWVIWNETGLFGMGLDYLVLIRVAYWNDDTASSEIPLAAHSSGDSQ